MHKLSNTHVDAKDLDVVMLMYNLIEYSYYYSKTSGSVYQYFRDQPALDNNNNAIVEFAGKDTTASFRFKEKNNSSNR